MAFDINNLMKQMESMGSGFTNSQEKMTSQIFTASSGGGLVSIEMGGDLKIRKIDIDKSLLLITEKEILEDLLISAMDNVLQKFAEYSAENVFGNLGNLFSFGQNSGGK